MDTICREYIKQTQMLFPIIRKKERIYLKSLYNDLIEYCNINKISNLQELFHEYGSPTQIVQEYLSSLNESDLKNCLKRKHIKKTLFICCVTVPAILIITFSVRLYLWNNLQKQVYSNIEMNTDPNTIYSIGDELNGNQTK